MSRISILSGDERFEYSYENYERMPTKGKYIAGKQVSRWDAESDNVDIEYKNLESHPKPSAFFDGRKGCALKILLLLACFSIGLIFGYIIRRNIHEIFISPKHKTPKGLLQDYDPKLSKTIQNDLLDEINYRDHINTLSQKVLLSGVGSTNLMIKYVKEMFSTFHLDHVVVKEYDVTLSYPNFTNPNRVAILASNTSVVFQSHTNASNFHPEYQPFNAYSPAGTVKSKLVYANFGSREDFEQLEKMNVSVEKNIVMIKYGRIHPANKVKHAEGRGAAGVILYSDPADFANNQSYVFPQTWWLPGWAVHSSHVRYTLVGDPQTPGYAAIEGVYRIPTYNASYPTIPVQPISYDDAREFLRNLDGQIAPNDWFGGLNITYRTGPGYLDGSIVELSVKNIREKRNISNTIAVIDGKYEKDRYIIIGAHVDSWTQGAVDAGTGYAVLWELARTFSYQVKNGWRPRRTLIFALWDGNSYGHIGSYEWVQEFEKELGPGAVAYINLDAVIRGNYSFSAEASPMLHDIIKSAAKTVTCTDPDYHDESVYDMWTKKFPSSDDPTQPKIHPPRGDSDHSPFIFHLGIPVYSPTFTYNTKLYSNMSTYPAFSTLEDTANYVNVFIDPHLKLHMAVTQITADVVLRLADSALIPIDICDFSKIFNEGKKYLSQYKSVFKAANIKLDHLNFWTQEFITTADNFHEKYHELYKEDMSEEEACEYNDKVMKVLRTFVISKGLPDNPQYRNILVAPHPENINTQQVYPGIAATLDEGLHNQNWSPLKEQVSYIIMALRQAVNILTEKIHGL